MSRLEGSAGLPRLFFSSFFWATGPTDPLHCGFGCASGGTCECILLMYEVLTENERGKQGQKKLGANRNTERGQ